MVVFENITSMPKRLNSAVSWSTYFLNLGQDMKIVILLCESDMFGLPRICTIKRVATAF